ncbi:3-isopropylmalate dehydrogenase [Arenibacter sp. GZD96]|uniref:3-isopropylmalate dehydrogenase n=1 Tax=Aurantibrevibacter litoralis TaxID=3106030 RepID=UPI002AFE830C|nr:3-isopropylmalate dehydrogenase [Arenibacter sp. GZD-96]MEA1787376.1 3-isopropylmalate dehydrogenase [Arenibacter sp. GZD-96]
MDLKIAVLAGDGIGPEVMAQAIKCLNAVADTFNHSFRFTTAVIGAEAMSISGNPLPLKTIQVCKASDAVLYGAVGHPKYDNDPTLAIRPEHGLFKLRKELDIFANIRPVKFFPTLVKKSPLKESIISGTDFVIYRELTGGTVFGNGNFNTDATSASDVYAYTETQISRIAHLAFKAARSRRKKLTLVDKANVFDSSKLWRKVVTKIGESYSDIELDFLYVDNAVTQIILHPTQFDVILSDTLFGDLLSNEASVIGGSIGLLPSASVGDETAMFEPVHGSYPEAAGKNIANPIACILSAALLLQYFGLDEEAASVVAAVNKSMRKNIVTPDLNAKVTHTTEEVGNFIATNIVETDNYLSSNAENIGLGRSTII